MDMILSGKSRLFSAVHGDTGKPGALEASNNQNWHITTMVKLLITRTTPNSHFSAFKGLQNFSLSKYLF
jgi:hypothetical protein